MVDENLPAINELDLPVSNVTEEKLAKLSEKSWLPYVKLVGSGSAEAEKGEIKPGTFLLVRDKSSKVQLTNIFECLVIAARPLAIHNTPTAVERYYDMESAGYKNVEKLSQVPNHMGDWHGTEFLLWIRLQRAWATYHASSETARSRSSELSSILLAWSLARRNKKLAIEKATKEGGDVAAAQAIVIPNPQAKFTSDLVFYKKVNKNQWAASYSPATTPFSEVPPFEEIRDQSLKFQNPPKVEKETVQAGTDTAGDVRG